MNKLFTLISVVGLITLFSCKEEDKPCELDAEILNSALDVSIIRLEDEFFNAKTLEEINFLLDSYPEFSEAFFQMDQYASKDELAHELLTIHQDTLMQELYKETKVNFGDISSIENGLNEAFQYLQYFFPKYKIPKVYTFVSGFGSDIIVSDKVIVIGLEYFLPVTHRFQPPDLPLYMSSRYQADYIVPMVVIALSSQFNKTDLKETSLLSEMIYYGKAYHFTKSILPCTSDEFIIGYSQDEIAACFANEELIWTHFVENDLLFETNPFVIRKYTGEAPSTDEISPDAPGRIGRWLGWNIVDDYRINKNISLEDLMQETNADKIFRQSGYRPRR